MRILVFNWLDLENPDAGGAEIHLHEVFGRLVTRGHDVTLLTSSWAGGSPRGDRDGLEIHRTGGRYTYSLAAPAYYLRHLRRRSFDVVVEDLNKVPIFVPLWATPPSLLLVHHLFGAAAFQEASLPLAAGTWFLERPLPLAYREGPVVAISESTAEDLRLRGISRERTTVIPNGVDVEFFHPVPDEPPFPEPTLLYLGRLKRYKGVDLLIRAGSRLVRGGMRCRILIAGKGDYEGELRELRDRLGLGDHVEFLGFVSEEKKRTLYRRSWIHVIASAKEGWGISVVEAGACGTPTVASDSPGLRDSVVHEETGLLVPHGEVEPLSRTLGSLLEDPDRRRRLGRNAREYAARFSWDRAARRMEEALAERVASTSRRT